MEFSTIGSLNFAADSNLSIQAFPGSKVHWKLFGHEGVDLSGVALENDYGSIEVRSERSDLTIHGASQLSALGIEASAVGELSVHASTLISTGIVRLSAESALNLAANAFLLGQQVELLSHGDLAVDSSNMTVSTFSATPDLGPLLASHGDLAVDSSNMTVSTFSATPDLGRLLAKATGAVTLSGYTNLSGRSIDIKSETDSIEVFGSTVTLSATDRVELDAPQLVRVDASSISANFIRLQADEIRSNAASYTGTDLLMEGGALVDLQQIDFSGLSTISMGAQTLVLADVKFPTSGGIYLQSELGQLAANPNTNAAAQTGYVNFIHNVTVGNLPAQDFVSTAQGGNHSGSGSLIQIAPLGTPGN